MNIQDLSLAMAIMVSTALSPIAAAAHASLAEKEAKQNTNYIAVMRITHGCAGEATNRVTITIPEGVINAKPMPKAGWTLETVRQPYAKTYEYHGPKSEGVVSISWSGHLEDGHFDEFVFRARVTDAFPVGETVYFPTMQTCVNGENAWVEVPQEGQTRGDLKSPAPGVTIVTGGNEHH
ncbi:MAG: YcnI family protein [Marinovum sp.]|nr:YcnI family protein [Marinovum sp.]